MSPICQKLSFLPKRSTRSGVAPAFTHSARRLVVGRDLVVAFEDGEPEPLGLEAVDVDQQLPGEADRVFLEVIAEREVAEHLEERVMARGAADVLEVVVLAAGADAFLRGRGARCSRAVSRPRKTSLNWFIPAFVKSSVGIARRERATSWRRGGGRSSRNS